MVHVFAYEFHQIGSIHHGAAHHEVIFSLLLKGITVLHLHILQPDGLRHRLRHAGLFANAVNQLEVALRKEYGQGDAGKTAPRTNVEQARAGHKLHRRSNAKGVQHVVGIKIVNVLA